MPRIENAGENVQAWCREHRLARGTTYDLCAACLARLGQDASLEARLVPTGPGEPRGEDGWVDDVDHPPYAYCPEHCALCGVLLTGLDDRRAMDCCSTEQAARKAHTARLHVTKMM